MTTLQEELTNALSNLDSEEEKRELLKYLDIRFDETLKRISENKWDNFLLHLKLTSCTMELVIKAGKHMQTDELEDAINILERGLGYFANIAETLKEELLKGGNQNE